jgi:hypothetical protein
LSDLSSLIAEVEKADKPDRGLDAKISAVLEPHLFDAPGFTPIRPIPDFRYDPSENVIRFEGGGLMDIRFFPPVTSSIDAAVSMAERVLPNWQINLSIFHDALSEASFGSRDHYREFTFAKTPALALVLATLRALDQKGSVK